jgi:hypothetical protein
MTKPCSTPGCFTLTYGEICLGCMQRKARDQQQPLDCAEAQHAEHASATDPA